MEGKEYITIKEAMEYLGCSRSFVYKLMLDRLPTHKLSRRTYIKMSELKSLFIRQ